jgi:hypothetical protein
MSTAPALTLLDGIACDHTACSAGVRAQVALVRALVDEIDRGRSGANALALHEQLDEESDRLAQMLDGETPAPLLAGGVEAVGVAEDAPGS